MKGTKVASRYAQALLDLAVQEKVLDQVNSDMENFHAVCKESKDLSNMLKSPIIDSRRKVTALNAVFGKDMNKMSVSFFELIVKKSRASLLPEIAESFISLSKKQRNILDLYLTSASPLDAATKEKILQKVKAKFAGHINVIEQIDATLIGGFIVRVDDKQLDASIANQLTNLRNLLLN